MAPPILIEMALAKLLDRGTLPRAGRAASSSREARELIGDLRGMLDELGLAEPASIDDAPEEFRRSVVRDQTDGIEYWQYRTDDVLAEWFQALAAQARGVNQSVVGGEGNRKKKRQRRKR